MNRKRPSHRNGSTSEVNGYHLGGGGGAGQRVWQKLIVFILAGVLVLGGVAYGIWRYQQSQWQHLTNADPKFGFDYHKKMNLTRVSEEEKKKGQIFIRLTEGTILQPLLVSIRLEKGLRLVTSLTRQEMIPYLLNSVEGAHPQRFPEYTKESEREFELSGKKAAELLFTYTGPAGEKIKQRFLIVAYDGDTALYFAAQAKTSDFDSLNQRYFNRMFESLRFE